MDKLEQSIYDATVQMLTLSVTKLPPDVKKAIESHISKATNESAKSELLAIKDNYELAEKNSIPMCQDTGLITFDIEIGDEFPIKSKLEQIMKEAVKEATTKIPLRPNTVDIFDGNTKNNVCKRGWLPWFNYKLVAGKDCVITLLNKGGGSTNVAALGLLSAAGGMPLVKQFVVDTVIKAGFKACPPYAVGIGIGGGEEMCMVMAKKALKRKLGQRNSDARVAELEAKFEEALNVLDIGVMGKGDSPTVLGVNIEMAARHPASFPCGVVISCWALRRATATIKNDGTVSITQ